VFSYSLKGGSVKYGLLFWLTATKYVNTIKVSTSVCFFFSFFLIIEFLVHDLKQIQGRRTRRHFPLDIKTEEQRWRPQESCGRRSRGGDVCLGEGLLWLV